MNPQDAIDFSREALKTCLMVGGPILVASLLIGLLVGLFQAMTQVQDQTVSFVPKILLLILMIGLCLPWLTNRMLDFAKQSFETPMTHWAGNSHQRLFAKPETDTKLEALDEVKLNSSPRTSNTLSAHLIKHAGMNGDHVLPQRNSKSRPGSEPAEIAPPFKSPFLLPHYRTSQAPKSEIGG